jgi:ectoine hydroxylase-related dioxygenase (phytanoyl-CoA dioxygenase family)
MSSIVKSTPRQEDLEALDRDGYVILDGMMSEEEIASCKAAIREIGEAEGLMAGHEYTLCNDGAFRLHNLLNKTTVFDRYGMDPLVLRLVDHVLPQYMLSMLNVRAALPSQPAQKLHVDWDYGAVAPGDYFVCNAMWLLDDFTVDNGATRFVPGSHAFGTLPQDALEDRLATHPDERLALAPAGSVVFFNSHIWHGGTENTSQGARAAINAYYSRREIPPVIDHRELLSPETKARFSDAELELLDAR